MGADAEIRTVLARIAQLADTGDLDEYITMFTSDTVWAMPENPLLGMPANSRQGHEAILEGARERRASGLQGPGTDTRHLLTTLAIEVVDDTARERALLLPVLRRDEHGAGGEDHGPVRRRAREG